MQKIVKELELALKELKEETKEQNSKTVTGIGSIKESTLMVCKSPNNNIVGKKRIPDVKLLEKMSAKDLA